MINIHTWWLIPPSRSYPTFFTWLGQGTWGSPQRSAPWPGTIDLPVDKARQRATVDGASHGDQNISKQSYPLVMSK